MGLQVAGVDIATLYKDVATGGTATAANTDIQWQTTDISDIFAEIGTGAGGTFGVTIPVSITGPGTDTPTKDTASIISADVVIVTGASITPYTYFWEYVSGSASVVFAASSSSSTKFPTWESPTAAGTYNAVWKLTLTDSTLFTPLVAVSGNMTINLFVNN
jgi:hypothetical protein